MSTTAQIKRVYVEVVMDEDPDLSWLEQDYNDPSITPAEATQYRALDAARLEEYRRGTWYTVGVRLAAEVELERQGRVSETITLTTPGVWGVESDSGANYLREIAVDETEWLADDLIALGFARDLVFVRIAFDLAPENLAVVES